MKQKTIIDELDETSHQLARSLVTDVRLISKEIPHPALSHKLTPQELWEKYGEDYMAMRDDPQAWQTTLDQMGEPATVEFGRAMEKALARQEGRSG